MVASRGFDATILAQLEPEDLLRDRLHMKMALARYARIDPFTWEDRDVTEMREHFEALLEMLKREGVSRQEDR